VIVLLFVIDVEVPLVHAFETEKSQEVETSASSMKSMPAFRVIDPPVESVKVVSVDVVSVVLVVRPLLIAKLHGAEVHF